MMLFGACALLLAAAASAAVVERGHPAGWRALAAADFRALRNDTTISFMLALHQRNMDELKALVLDRADPTSARYGQWLTPAAVRAMVAPPAADTARVVAWARAQGLWADGARGDVVRVRGSKAAVERALRTELAEWEHAASAHRRVGTLRYELPDDVAPLVELLSGLTEFWVPPAGARRVPLGTTTRNGVGNNVQAGYVIPDTVRRLYGVPKDDFRDVSAKSSVCVAEFQDYASYSKSDLGFFDQQTDEHRSHVDHIVGPYRPGGQAGIESQLDIEYASTIALNSTYWYWTVQGWMLEFASDLNNHPNAPDVVSMSWGWPEPSQCQIADCQGSTSTAYVRRCDNEFAKFTATGKTLLGASGDQGAPGDSYAGSCQGISDIYPGGSPWVLSVGATMLNDKAQPTPPPPKYQPPPVCQQKKCSMVTEEVVCSIPEGLITSGGGASAYEPMPKWQMKAVQAYLKNPKANLPPSNMFNKRNRMFPDVSAIGHAILIGVNNEMVQVDGTSASAPEMAAMIALLNGWRLDNGKPTLGFVNPLMYEIFDKDPAAFKDITQGNNKCSERCCGQYGFSATEGWDASTGLGAIHFPKILEHVKKLP